MDASLYQQNRQKILAQVSALKDIYEDLKYKDTSFFNELPQEISQRLTLIERDISRLRNPNLTIAFVGGFSAGKSSLINAFLGRYLLPESTEVTTAVPTYVRSASGDEYASIHYLNADEVEQLDALYRREIADAFRMPQLENAPVHELLEKVQPIVQEGRGSQLVKNFNLFLEKRKNRTFSTERHIEKCSLSEMQRLVRDESEAIFLDRVEVYIKSNDIPSDVILVDLPGVSVPNPRHREVTFRFVSQDAHAVIFVLTANKLFDRDEQAIMEKIRAGDSQITRKTFWVLNRWDALTTQQRESSLANFRDKMQEFAIPDNYNYFTTNALHGLLAQLRLREELPSDSKLQQHLLDYKEILPSRYDGKDDVALKESQISSLRNNVLEFLNQGLRKITLETTANNVEENFCKPILHYLRARKDADESLVQGELQQSEREQARQLTTEHINQRKKELEGSVRCIRERVANARRTMFTDQAQAKELEETLREEIKSGNLTDTYQVYTRIIADNPLRKYPYYFEIEIKVVDNLNQMLKESFLKIVRQQVNTVIDDLVGEINKRLDELYADVEYDPNVSFSFSELMKDVKTRFQGEVDGVVKERTARLDELLVYKSDENFSSTNQFSRVDKILYFMKRDNRTSSSSGTDNKILKGLEKAARMQSKLINDSAKSISKEDMKERTNQIRATLEQHYVEKTIEFREEVAEAVWPILINQMLELEKELEQAINTRYLTALEQIKSKQAANEFASRRCDITSRTNRFRNAIDKIYDLSTQMRSVL
jgi:putative lipoic acid-binding regulatory protein